MRLLPFNNYTSTCEPTYCDAALDPTTGDGNPCPGGGCPGECWQEQGDCFAGAGISECRALVDGVCQSSSSSNMCDELGVGCTSTDCVENQGGVSLRKIFFRYIQKEGSFILRQVQKTIWQPVFN